MKKLPILYALQSYVNDIMRYDPDDNDVSEWGFMSAITLMFDEDSRLTTLKDAIKSVTDEKFIDNSDKKSIFLLLRPDSKRMKDASDEDIVAKILDMMKVKGFNDIEENDIKKVNVKRSLTYYVIKIQFE